MSGILKINAVNMQTNSRPVTSLKGKHLSKYRNQTFMIWCYLVKFAFRMIIQANGFMFLWGS